MNDDDPWDSHAKPNPFPSLGEHWDVPPPKLGYEKRLMETAETIGQYSIERALELYQQVYSDPEH